MSEQEKFLIWVGELSTQDNLKNIHPEHVKHICEQARNMYLDAFVAELGKECIDERGKGDDMDKMIYLGKIRETAKRMKGEG